MLQTKPTISLTNLLKNLPAAASDRIGVRHAQPTAPGDLSAMVAADWDAFIKARVVIVDAAKLPLARNDVSALSNLAAYGVRIVVAGGERAAGFTPMLVLHEPEFPRAAVASIYNLAPGATAVLLTPEPSDASELQHIVHHALAWRASWQDPETGDFNFIPT